MRAGGGPRDSWRPTVMGERSPPWRVGADSAGAAASPAVFRLWWKQREPVGNTDLVTHAAVSSGGRWEGPSCRVAAAPPRPIP